MKHLSSIVLAVALIAAGATACFKDPTSSLRNGPSRIELTRSSMVLRVGDSLSVQAVVKDDQGMTFGAGDATWTTSAPSVAVVRRDATVDIPYDAYSLAFVRAIADSGGVATITVTSQGITQTLRVVVLPVALTASAAVSVAGTASADTIPGVTPIVITAGDTVIFTARAGSNLTFNPTASLVGFGLQRPAGYVLRTATQIKAILNAPYGGRPWVTNLIFTGNAATGTLVLDSLQSDSIVVARFRREFKGTVTQTGDTVVVDAPVGGGFSTTGTLSGARFGARAAWVVARTAAQLRLLTPTAVTSRISLTNPMVGQAILDTLYTLGTYTTTIPTFPGAITQPGDTVVVAAPTGTTFDTLTSGVRFGARAAWLVARTAAELRVMSPVAVTDVATVTNLHVGLATVDSLKTPLTYTSIIPTFPGTVTQTGDTMFLAAATGTTFDTLASVVRFGARTAWLLRRTPTQLAVMSPVGTLGPVTATRVRVGLAWIDSLKTPVNYTPTIPTFGGTITQLADTMTIVPAAGTMFDIAAATASTVRFGSAAAVVLSRTATQLKVMSPVAWNGVVTATNVLIGTTRVDSLKTTGSYTINAATFVGTVTTAGKLLDTVKVYAGTGFQFTTTPANVSNVMIGGAAAWVLLRTADSMYVISRMPSTGQIGVTNATVGTALIPPQLNIAGNVVITEIPSGELNEPANDAPGAVAIDLSTATAANPLVIWGAVDGDGNGLGTDADDFFAFTTTEVKTITIQLQFAGTGAGGATNPDMDLLVCNATCSAWVSTAGATGAQPENITLTNRAAGTYNIYVNGWDTGSLARPYKLIVYTN